MGVNHWQLRIDWQFQQVSKNVPVYIKCSCVISTSISSKEGSDPCHIQVRDLLPKLAREVFEEDIKRENFVLKILQTQVSSTKYFPAQHFLVFHETRKNYLSERTKEIKLAFAAYNMFS